MQTDFDGLASCFWKHFDMIKTASGSVQNLQLILMDWEVTFESVFTT